MKARFATLALALSTLGLTGCTGGFGSCFADRGAPCGPACSPAASPGYDMTPGYGYSNMGDCDCGNSYAGSSPAAYWDGNSNGAAYGPGYGNGWIPADQIPQPGQIIPGEGTVVPPTPNTQMAPALAPQA